MNNSHWGLKIAAVALAVPFAIVLLYCVVVIIVNVLIFLGFTP
jgi:hypothetical protein